MNISVKKRWDIVFLSKHEYGPHMPNVDISHYLRTSESTVRYWLKRYETTGDEEIIQRSGRKRSTTEKQDDVIQSMVTQHPTESTRQISFRLSKKGINISETTLRRKFKEASVQSMRPTFKPLLTNDHIKKRLQWAIQHQDIDWNEVVLTDESSFHMKHVIRHVWKRRGDKYYVPTVKHSAKIHVWGCFSKHRFSKLVLFRQTLDSKLMCKIYKNGLLSSAKKWFSNTNCNWKLLEDDDPKHVSKTSKTFKINNGYTIITLAVAIALLQPH